MMEEYKLEIALQLVEQLTDLLDGNEYQQFFYQHIIPVEVELKRQLTNIQYHSTIQE